MIFADREEAGVHLAAVLSKFRRRDGVVFGLPRGGVILGKIVADKLDMPLELLIPRKIGHPDNPEFAIGAISEDGTLVNEIEGVSEVWLRSIVERETQEAKRRRQLYAQGKMPSKLKGRLALIVDDGVATGFTLLAAIQQARQLNPLKVVVAVPVIPKDRVGLIKAAADELIALIIDPDFAVSVGSYYRNFPEVSDEEVIKALA
jgi:predicted phosphoribosyltransferase